MNLAKKLYELQQIDLEIQKKQDILDEVNRQLGESKTILTARNELVEAKKYLEEVEKQRRDVEWEVEDLRTSISQLKEKLYGGKVKNPKELLNLEQESELFKARLRQKEDNLLDLMTEEETTQERIKSDTKRLKEIEGEWQKEQEALMLKRGELLSQLLNSSQERQVMVSGIDGQAIKLYEDVRLRKGRAVVRVEQGRCQGCRLTLPMNEWQRARTGSLVQCSSCGMILYLG